MYLGLWLPFARHVSTLLHPIVHLGPLLTPIKGRSMTLVREGWPRGRTGRRTRLSLSLSHANACNPLLQAHPPWAQDNTKAAGSPLLFLSPLCSVSRRPIWAGTRSDNLLVGPGTPRVETSTNSKLNKLLYWVNSNSSKTKGSKRPIRQM
jgi:hypothetical protein